MTGTDELLERLRRIRSLPPAEERKRIREAAKVSKRELATALGVAWGTISRWESGHDPRNDDDVTNYLYVLSELHAITADPLEILQTSGP